MRMSSPTSDVLDLILHFNNTEQYGLTSDVHTLKPVQGTLSCELEASWSVCRGGIFMRVGKTSCILGKHLVEGKTTEGLLNCSPVRFIHLPSSLCFLSPHSLSHSTVCLPLWAVIVYKPVYIRTGLWHRKESRLFWCPQQLPWDATSRQSLQTLPACGKVPSTAWPSLTCNSILFYSFAICEFFLQDCELFEGRVWAIYLRIFDTHEIILMCFS